MGSPDYLNPDLPIERRVADLLPRMTLAEKAGQLFHPPTAIPGPDFAWGPAAEQAISRQYLSHFNVANGVAASDVANWTNTLQAIAADTRLGIPVTLSSDPRSGIRSSSPFTGVAQTALSRWPEHPGIAATHDPDLVRAYGDTVRREFTAMGIRVYLGPMADLSTDPRWSRTYGTFGEDPELVAEMVVAFIEGLRGGQSLGPTSVAAMVKHFPGAGPQLDGWDAHDPRHKEQVYPGGMQELHLRPFQAAFRAGVTQVMPYYGMPVGTDWEERGFAFNAPVIRDLLRGRFAFDGIVCTDWHLLEATVIAGMPFGPNGYGAGVEDVSPSDRLAIGVDVGVDQFGGDDCVDRVLELVERGRISEDRIDASVRRTLREKFRLGLFEHRYVDADRADEIVADPAAHARGVAAQAAALTLLQDHDVLPLASTTAVYAEGMDASEVERVFLRVDTPADADVAILRLDAPWESDPDSPMGDEFHSGSLVFAAETVERVRAVADQVPTIVVVYLDRPAILCEMATYARVLLADFGASDRVILDAVRGRTTIAGQLPFDLPRSMAAVEQSREDVPFDTRDPLFHHRFGMEMPASTDAHV